MTRVAHRHECTKRFKTGRVQCLYDRLEHSREGALAVGLESALGCNCKAQGYLAELHSSSVVVCVVCVRPKRGTIAA